MSLFFQSQLTSFRDAMPFFQASPAASGSGMLRDKYRVAAKRGLFAVVGNSGRGKTPRDEIFGMSKHHGQAFALQVSKLLTPQIKAAAKSRFSQCSEKVVKVSQMKLS